MNEETNTLLEAVTLLDKCRQAAFNADESALRAYDLEVLNLLAKSKASGRDWHDNMQSAYEANWILMRHTVAALAGER